ncbi:hypothetical protein KGQ24_00350 [Patescibacteria group bacterium]|nr:hypothetical protein [Patescibacteria group bacterium]
MAWIKKVYLYLVSLISLVMVIFAATMLINMGLKAWIFKAADYYPAYPVTCIQTPDSTSADKTQACPDQQQQDEYQKAANKSTKERQAAQSIALLIVALPVFIYHWKLARKEA